MEAGSYGRLDGPPENDQSKLQSGMSFQPIAGPELRD